MCDLILAKNGNYGSYDQINTLKQVAERNLRGLNV